MDLLLINYCQKLL